MKKMCYTAAAILVIAAGINIQAKANEEVKLADIKNLQDQIDILEKRVTELENLNTPACDQPQETYLDYLVDEYGNVIYDEYGNMIWVEVPFEPIIQEENNVTDIPYYEMPFVPANPGNNVEQPSEEPSDTNEDQESNDDEHEEDMPHEELPQETELLPFSGDAGQYMQDILYDGYSHEWYTDNEDEDKIYIDGNQLIIDGQYVTFQNIKEWYEKDQEENATVE